MGLVAVIMGAADGKIRFQEAAQLLDYGFANYKVKVGPVRGSIIGKASVKKGDVEEVDVATEETKAIVVPKGNSNSELTYEISYPRALIAPIAKGQGIGIITYYLEGSEVGQGKLIATSEVKKATLKQMMPYMFKRFFKLSK